MTLHLPAAAYDGMAKQSKRLQQEPTLQQKYDDLRVKLAAAERERDNALAEVERLNKENDTLNLKAHRAGKVNGADSSTGTFINGRRVVNQVEAAEILNVPQFKVSRWVKAGKFQTVTVPGYKIAKIYADSLIKPEPGKPGRKKK